MISGKSVLGLIPARMGSKRIPMKNIREFKIKNKSQSLLMWAIEAAKNSKYIDRIVVSTDHPNISSGIPGIITLVRPNYLSTDTATSESVALHALSLYPAERIVLIQPTSPYRTAADIDRCLELAAHSGACISINEATGKRNGAVYIAGPDCAWSNNPAHYPMPASRSLDIDTEDDLQQL